MRFYTPHPILVLVAVTIVRVLDHPKVVLTINPVPDVGSYRPVATIGDGDHDYSSGITGPSGFTTTVFVVLHPMVAFSEFQP